MNTDFTPSLKILKRDKKLAAAIRKYPPIDFGGRARTYSFDTFITLVRSITAQQISGKSATSIFNRVIVLFPRQKPTPALMIAIPTKKLRKAGLSERKVLYIRDLAEKFLNGTINEKKFPKMSSQEIIDHLVQVKGVGEWTAQMLLIFMLQRPDILPVDDLAIRKGFQAVYKLKEMPTKKLMEETAKPWRAHATAASWYFWRASREIPQTKKTKKEKNHLKNKQLKI